MKVLTQKKYQDHVPCSFPYKLICVDNEFTKSIVVFKDENAAYKFNEAILKDFECCKKLMKKHFKKNLIMNNFNQVTFAGFVKKSLMMTMKK